FGRSPQSQFDRPHWREEGMRCRLRPPSSLSDWWGAEGSASRSIGLLLTGRASRGQNPPGFLIGGEGANEEPTSLPASVLACRNASGQPEEGDDEDSRFSAPWWDQPTQLLSLLGGNRHSRGSRPSANRASDIDGRCSKRRAR